MKMLTFIRHIAIRATDAAKQYALNTSVLAVLLAVGGQQAGCDRVDSQKTWDTIHIADDGSGDSAKVVIYSPPYYPGANTHKVRIRWDGRQVFCQQLPVRTGGGLGMPITLMEIDTAPGTHVLEVKHKSEIHRESVELAGSKKAHFRLFGEVDGRLKLLVDLGSNPGFQ